MKQITKPTPKDGVTETTEEETVTTYDMYKFTSTPPKDVVEALLADTIKEIYSTFLVTAFEQSNKLSQMESYTAAVSITIAHLEQAVDLLSCCGLKTLTPKHRAVARVLPLWLSRFQFIAEAIKDKPETSVEAKESARETSQIISLFHILMDNKTNQNFRNTIVKDVLGDVNEA